MGLERGRLNPVSTTEELENRECGRKDPSRWPRGTIYSQKLALSSPTSGGSPVGIVRSRTKATEISLPSDIISFKLRTPQLLLYNSVYTLHIKIIK
jgi:hypothetical protein